ncbi:MAG: nuclear transport factor 2 family protein [Vicinamibacterales bacterium]
MRRRAVWVAGVVGVGLAASVAAVRQGEADEGLIREARARSNRAIAAHDVAGIAREWMPDVNVMTSTSAQATGVTPNAARMTRQFETRPDTVYVRQPTTVDVWPAWQVASERGEWTGRWTEPDGPIEIGGPYMAQWRKVEGTWRIQAELFVPTRCRGGAYCGRRP